MASSVSISILLIKSDPDKDNSSFSTRCVVIPTYLVVVLCSEIVHSRTDNRFGVFEASRGRFVAIGGVPIWIADVGTFVVGVEIRCDCRKACPSSQFAREKVGTSRELTCSLGRGSGNVFGASRRRVV